MLTDPLSITVNGNAISLPRISAGQMQSLYRSADGAYGLRISHTVDGRARSLVRLDRSITGADPLLPATNKSYAASMWLVVDRPLNGVGFSNTEMGHSWAGFTGLLNSAGFKDKIFGLEN